MRSRSGPEYTRLPAAGLRGARSRARIAAEILLWPVPVRSDHLSGVMTGLVDGKAAELTGRQSASLIMNGEPHGRRRLVGPRNAMTYMGADVNIAAGFEHKWLGLAFEN